MMPDNPLQFIKWDFDNNTAIEYERLGECNGCGACCSTIIRFKTADSQDRDPVWALGDGAEFIGVWTEVSRGRIRRFYRVLEIDTETPYRCSALTDDNKCTVHHERKPLLCRVYPGTPEEVEKFPECSYTFSEIRRWVIDDDPHI